MADVTAHADTKYAPRGDSMSFVIEDAVTLYRMALVGIQAGYANHWADGANDLFAGVAFQGDDHARAATADAGTLTGDTDHARGAPEVVVLTGGVTLKHLDSVLDEANAALAATDVGRIVYATSSNTDDIGMSSSSRNHPVGFISRWRSATDVDVTLFSIGESGARMV